MVHGTRKGKRNLVRACAARYWKSDWNPPVAAPPLSYLYSDAVVPLPKRDIIITHCVRWSVGFFSHERVCVCECVVYYTFRRTTRNGARVSLGIPVSSYVRVMRACVWFCSRPKRRRVVYIIGGLRRPNPACRAPRVRVPSPPKRNTVASFPRLRFICLSGSRTYASFSRPKPCVYSFAAFFFFLYTTKHNRMVSVVVHSLKRIVHLWNLRCWSTYMHDYVSWSPARRLCHRRTHRQFSRSRSSNCRASRTHARPSVILIGACTCVVSSVCMCVRRESKTKLDACMCVSVCVNLFDGIVLYSLHAHARAPVYARVVMRRPRRSQYTRYSAYFVVGR